MQSILQFHVHPGHAEEWLSNITRILQPASVLKVGQVMGVFRLCTVYLLMANP